VQTFLPYADFERSARALDQRRLGKQRVECIQVVRGLTVAGYGWRHHPAVTMWRGSEAATIAEDLARAGIAAIRTQPELAAAGALPAWLGDEDFHRSHRSSLLRKDPDFYGARFPDVPDDLPYVWPSAS
jgi:hypothetical protein